MNAPTQYRIDGDSSREIAASIERGIERGELASGERLPSVRTLATELAVSPSTVSAALAELRSRGLITSRERSGTRVSWRPPVASAGLVRRVPEGVRDLATGNPDPALLPAIGPYLRRLEVPEQLYGGDYALPELVELAAAELEPVGVSAEHLAIVSGALDGIERVVRERLDRGDVVAVEDPGFPGIFDLLRAQGLALHPVEIDDRGMRPAALAAALGQGAKAVVVNSRGQNPTGATLDRPRAEELREVLDEHPSALLIEDDHLGPIAGAERVSLTAGRERWAATRSVAKSLGPDIRLAVLAGDERTISRVRGRQAVGPQWVSHLLQRLTVELWSDPACVESLREAARIYEQRRGAFVEALSARGIDVRGHAGINVWIPVDDEASVAAALREDGWAVSPGAPYRLDPESEPGIRVTISTLTPAEAPALAEAVDAAIRPSGDLTRSG